KLRSTARLLKTAADELQELAGTDEQIAVQLVDLWRFHRIRRSGGPLDAMATSSSADFRDDCRRGADILGERASFLDRAATAFNPAGPAPVLGQMGDGAQATMVIRYIADTCQWACGGVLYGTVARLANASLNRTDIDEQTVRRSLHSG